MPPPSPVSGYEPVFQPEREYMRFEYDLSYLPSGPYLEKYFGVGVNMNIYYGNGNPKFFKVNFFEVVYATLTLSGINITILVNFFLCPCYRCLVERQEFGKMVQNRGSGGKVLRRQHIFTFFT